MTFTVVTNQPGVLILLSGIALASRLGVGRAPFVAVSFAGIVLMTVLGRIALGPLLGAAKDFRQTGAGPVAELRQLASRPLLRASFRIRVWIALAIVYLMIAKPDLIECTVVLAIALLIAIVGSVGRGRSPATMSAREDAATPPARPIGGS